MKITANQLKQIVRESLEEMGMDDEQRKAMLAAQYSDVYKEKNGIRPRWVKWKEMSIEQLEGMLDDLYAAPDMMDDYEKTDYEEPAIDDEDAAAKAWGQEMADKHHEFEQSKVPEEGEEHPKHLGMGRHLRETIKLMVSEVLEEAKAKKYKGKSMRKGGGGRFAKLVDKLKSSGKSEESAKAIAASAGREKYGAKEMAKMAKVGKKRAAKK